MADPALDPRCARCRRAGHLACAFERGVFGDVSPLADDRHDPRKCESVRAIRNIVREVAVWHDDQHAALLPIPLRSSEPHKGGRFLLVGYYKERWATEEIAVLDDTVHRMTREEADEIVALFEAALGRDRLEVPR